MKKSIIAGASVLALAGAVMPMAGVFAVPQTDTITDTVKVTVEPSCNFTTKGGATEDGTYVFEGTNGNAATAAAGAVHTFNVFCNDNNGYTVSASAQNLSDIAETDPIADVFTYTGGDNPTLSGLNGLWHAQFASENQKLIIKQIDSGSTSGTIVTAGEASVTSGEVFTATYSVYVGSETPAGTYSGQIEYTLTSAS